MRIEAVLLYRRIEAAKAAGLDPYELQDAALAVPIVSKLGRAALDWRDYGFPSGLRISADLISVESELRKALARA